MWNYPKGLLGEWQHAGCALGRCGGRLGRVIGIRSDAPWKGAQTIAPGQPAQRAQPGVTDQKTISALEGRQNEIRFFCRPSRAFIMEAADPGVAPAPRAYPRLLSRRPCRGCSRYALTGAPAGTTSSMLDTMPGPMRPCQNHSSQCYPLECRKRWKRQSSSMEAIGEFSRQRRHRGRRGQPPLFGASCLRHHLPPPKCRTGGLSVIDIARCLGENVGDHARTRFLGQ